MTLFGNFVRTRETAQGSERKTEEGPDTTAAAPDQDAGATYHFEVDSETLKQAWFSDNYWDVHRSFELKGRISHSKDQCPERNGPRFVRVWDAENGWHDMRPAGP